MNYIVHSEYRFEKELKSGKIIGLDVYLNHRYKTYDIMQDRQEGIMFKHNNDETETNMGYMFLALEALEFINETLYKNEYCII